LRLDETASRQIARLNVFSHFTAVPY